MRRCTHPAFAVTTLLPWQHHPRLRPTTTTATLTIWADAHFVSRRSRLSLRLHGRDGVANVVQKSEADIPKVTSPRCSPATAPT